MKTKKLKFRVVTGQQNPDINKLLRCADLANAALIDDGSGYIVELTCKKSASVKKIKDALQKAFEQYGYCVLGIKRR